MYFLVLGSNAAYDSFSNDILHLCAVPVAFYPMNSLITTHNWHLRSRSEEKPNGGNNKNQNTQREIRREKEKVHGVDTKFTA